MNWKTTISIFLISAAFAGKLTAQHASELNSFRDLFSPETVKHDFSLKIDNSNEIRLVLTTSFAFYKLFISSQDGMQCTFHPTCSVYALNTIKTNGLIGVLDAIDRLSRCNGLSPEKYPVHETTHRFYDPVSKIGH